MHWAFSSTFHPCSRQPGQIARRCFPKNLEDAVIHRKPEDLTIRTRRFALAVVQLYASLPRSTISSILGKQLLRSGTSVGAHYREARRAKSDADFISKIEGALQELDESGYWIELLGDASVAEREMVEKLSKEINELIAIFVTMVTRVKARISRRASARILAARQDRRRYLDIQP
jgi:four helix bundle protein